MSDDDIEIDFGTAPASPATPEPTPCPLDAEPYELKALEAFMSDDETRPFLNTVWSYGSTDGVDPDTFAPRVVGRTYAATDGHVLCCRRSGTHARMARHDVFALPPVPLSGVPGAGPPPWEHMLAAPDSSANAPEGYSVNPEYVGLVALVEKAACKRLLASIPPGRGTRDLRQDAPKRCATRWRVASSPLDPWLWSLDLGDVLWEGVIMTRRP